MNRSRSRIPLFLLLVLALTFLPHPVQAEGDASLPALQAFIESVSNGEAESLRGLYIPGVLAALVVPQPEGEPGFVSFEANTLTQFTLATRAGSTGLLAHNYLAGKELFRVQIGQLMYLVYGDGRTAAFIVTDLQRFQALDPQDIRSNFLDLRSGRFYSTRSLFNRIYNRSGDVILQTCIEWEGETSWGRLFVIAEPYTVSGFEPSAERAIK